MKRPYVIVVDDEADTRAAVGSLVELILGDRPGAIVTSASSSDDALSLVDRAPPEAVVIVISDFDLGEGRNGSDVLAEAQRRVPGCRRVLLSGCDVDDVCDVSEFSDCFVQKPPDVAEFTELVLALADGQAAPRRVL